MKLEGDEPTGEQKYTVGKFSVKRANKTQPYLYVYFYDAEETVGSQHNSFCFEVELLFQGNLENVFKCFDDQ